MDIKLSDEARRMLKAVAGATNRSVRETARLALARDIRLAYERLPRTHKRREQ